MVVFSYHKCVKQTKVITRQLLFIFVWSLLFAYGTAALGQTGEPAQDVPEGMYTLFDAEHSQPIGKWTKPPIEKPDYPTDEFIILDNNNAIKGEGTSPEGFLGNTKVPYSYFHLLADNGIHGSLLWGYTLPENPGLTREQDEAMINRGMNTFYIDVPDEGRWIDMQQKPEGFFHNWGYGKTPVNIEDLHQWKTVNYLTETFPDCKVMLLVGGELEQVQFLTYPPTEHIFELIRKAYIQQHIDWVQRLKSNLSHPNKVVTFEQSVGAAYPIAYLLKAYDIAQTKNWSRQNVEIDLANNRGASRSYDKPMMMADDPWVGDLCHTRSPEEMEQVFYLSYFSGVDYLYHEYMCLVQKADDIRPNKWGQKYLDFGRFTATHPKRGRQIVKIAIMRGFGDTWSEIYTQYMPAGWDKNKSRRIHDIKTRDYQLLKAFFPKFGTYYQTDPFRFCTGTPYGPIDMIPWDTQLNKLETYDLVFYFGLNAMDDKQYHTLKKFVAQGGKLVMALGQLRMEGKDPRRILPAAFNDDFFGVQIEELPTMVEDQAEIVFHQDIGTIQDYYELKILKGNPVAVTQKDTRPVVIHKKNGKGEVWLYATDYISKVNEEANINFFTRLAEGVKPLTIEPLSDWIEYTVWEKENLYILPLFNHGRIRFPSGNGPDNGPWEGTITLAFDKFPKLRGQQLEAYRVEFADPTFEFTPLPMTKGKQDVSIKLTVDKRAEIIIGSKGATQREFFWGSADAK